MEKILCVGDNLSVLKLQKGKREGKKEKGAFRYCYNPFFHRDNMSQAAAVPNAKSIADAKKPPPFIFTWKTRRGC
jgi:hypothetical protein